MFAAANVPSLCPQCGCADVERMGNARSTRFLCIEGHMFEVPKRPGLLRRWRKKSRSAS